MKSKQIFVIGLGAVLVFSTVLGAISISSPRDSVTFADLNAELNAIVDICMQSLPEGLPECDERLRDIVDRLCQEDDSFDACSDGRVEEYYRARAM